MRLQSRRYFNQIFEKQSEINYVWQQYACTIVPSSQKVQAKWEPIPSRESSSHHKIMPHIVLVINDIPRLCLLFRFYSKKRLKSALLCCWVELRVNNDDYDHLVVVWLYIVARHRCSSCVALTFIYRISYVKCEHNIKISKLSVTVSVRLDFLLHSNWRNDIVKRYLCEQRNDEMRNICLRLSTVEISPNNVNYWCIIKRYFIYSKYLYWVGCFVCFVRFLFGTLAQVEVDCSHSWPTLGLTSHSLSRLEGLLQCLCVSSIMSKRARRLCVTTTANDRATQKSCESFSSRNFKWRRIESNLYRSTTRRR